MSITRKQFLRIIICRCFSRCLWQVLIFHKWASIRTIWSAWFRWTGSWRTGSGWTGSWATGTGRGSWTGRTWSLGTFVAPFSSQSHSTYLLFQLFDSFILFVDNISYFTQSCCCSWSWNYQMFFYVIWMFWDLEEFLKIVFDVLIGIKNKLSYEIVLESQKFKFDFIKSLAHCGLLWSILTVTGAIKSTGLIFFWINLLNVLYL